MENIVNLKLWDKLAQISPDILCILDAQGFFKLVNQASKKVIGYSCDELVGRSYNELVHSDYLLITQQALQKSLSSTESNSFENCFFHKNGNSVPLLWSAVWSEEDNGFLCVARDITRLKISRRKLEKCEQYYKTLFNNSSDLVYVQNKDGLVTDVNQTFLGLFGISREQLIGNPITAFMSPDTAAQNNKYLEQALLGNKVRFEFKFEKDGQLIILDSRKVPVVLEGEVIGVQSIIRSYEKVQRQTIMLNTFFESITDAFIMMDRDWKLTHINSKAERLVQIDKGKHLGKNIWSVFPEQVGGEFYINFQHALKTGKAVNFTAYLKEGGLWLQVKAFPSPEGMSVYFDDVTRQVESRHELEKLSIVASKTINGVVITDATGHVEWVNEGFTRITGYTLKEMVGKKPGAVLQGEETDQTYVKIVREQLRQGKTFNAQLINYKKSGEKFWMSMDITPIFGETGEIIQFIAIEKDITFRKAAETDLLKMTEDLYEQNSVLQQFTYIVSHNLRAPVANAIGLVGLLSKADKTSDQFDRILSYLSQSVMRLDSVLRDMNTILSIRERKADMVFEPVELLLVIEQVLSSYQDQLQKAGARVSVDIQEGIVVKASKAFLYSIFHNLLSNAIKYRSDERELEVCISSIKSLDDVIIVSFSDNGIGFDKKKAGSDIFKLYKRFHPDRKGRGIGLYLVKAHLEAMGGHVEVDSQVDIGTRFTIYLPI